jgi:class 3 adenylate cyclase
MKARVEPEWAMVTVVFVDIRGFTTFADRSTANEAVAYLNEFFGLVVPVLNSQRESQGTLQPCHPATRRGTRNATRMRPRACGDVLRR